MKKSAWFKFHVIYMIPLHVLINSPTTGVLIENKRLSYLNWNCEHQNRLFNCNYGSSWFTFLLFSYFFRISPVGTTILEWILHSLRVKLLYRNFGITALRFLTGFTWIGSIRFSHEPLEARVHKMWVFQGSSLQVQGSRSEGLASSYSKGRVIIGSLVL